MVKFAIQILCLAWLLTVTVLSSPANKRGNRANGCPSDELSNFPKKYTEDLQKRVLDRIVFVGVNKRDWLIKQRNFKRRLTGWVFQRLDKNKDGSVDYNEAVTGRWGLRGPRVCQIAFLQECDKDQSKSVSKTEWLNCFQITPECKKSCARGQLDTVLCQCKCPDGVIQGRVVTSSGAPLRDVGILLELFPYTEVARTNKSGHFSISDRCENKSYTVKKNDYIPLRLEGGIRGANPLTIQLEDAEPAYITANPKGKTRIAGQSVNFTCEAEGTPPIEISWYHNGRRLPELTVGMRSNLFIANVNGAQGLYTCKATNDYGSEMSSPGELKIKEEILDTCNRTPSSHIIKLPPGCREGYSGKNTLDIGQCSDEPCSQISSLSQTCAVNEDCCCRPRGKDYQERVLITCGGSFSEMIFYRVKECGCSSCVKREAVIKGEVVGGPNQIPVKNVKVIFRKRVVDRTNEEGKFSFVVTDDVDRLTVTFQDSADQFSDTTRTMPFQRGRTVVHRVVLQKEDPPVTFDSSKDLRVPLGHAGDNMAELELPADNLLDKAGKPFKGNAKLRVSLRDRRNSSDVFSMPGDFTTVDQSGSVQPLKTYGILQVKVQDENNEKLDFAGNMKIYLDADKITLPRNSSGEMAPWLWWLDEKTGRWRRMGEMKPADTSRTKRAEGGRRFYIGDIQTDKISYINIDIQWKRCYVRAQAYTKTNEGKQPVIGAEVTLIGKENANEEQYYGYTKAITNRNGIACIPAWCDSYVVLQSSKVSNNVDGSKRVIQLNAEHQVTLVKLSPQLEASSISEGNKSTSFQFIAKVTSQAGPIFAGDEMHKCRDVSDTLVAFAFYLEEKEIEVDVFDDFGSLPPGHPLSWYAMDASKPNQEPNKCFMKIRTEYYIEASVPMVSVQSFTPNQEIRYGFSIKEQTPTQETRTVDGYWNLVVAYACVEYRCSEIDKDTFLVVNLLTDYCVVPRPIPPLRLKNHQYENSTFTFTSQRSTSLYAPFDVSDGKLGLYTGPGKIAEERCKAGGEIAVGEGARKETSAGYAVLAIDPIECLPDEEPPWVWEDRQEGIGPGQ
ncbi:cartilage intermediate layer protein 1-like isoform X2 [Orbicella faveolata]|uniref:cartilage intermediate layer protein 1-like isoform X2 n=1 Tax=Orbicella faveolata TaxID=48498 RepID=UPI0009E40C64|nr:cartilage intermediate layer protein 1-like isoform X2 [Orbicella faveolata]